jgi:hypothetical protein
VVLVLGALLLTRGDDCPSVAADWRAARGSELRPDDRLRRMRPVARDLIGCGHEFDGRTRAETTSLLGRPDDMFAQGRGWTYEFGYSEGMSSPARLEIMFDSRGRLRSLQVPGRWEYER